MTDNRNRLGSKRRLAGIMAKLLVSSEVGQSDNSNGNPEDTRDAGEG